MFYLANQTINSTGLSEEQIRGLSEAFESHRIGDLEKAEAHYRRVLAGGYSCPEAFSNLGSILLEKGRARQARFLLEKANQRHPANAGITANLAACHGTLENWSDCQDYCAQASSIDASNPMPRLWTARASYAIDGPECAINLLETYTKDNRISDKQLLFSELVLYLSASNRRSRAIGVIATGLRHFPDSTPILNTALAVALSTGRAATFAKITSKIISSESPPSQYLYYHARLLLANQQEADAITILLEAVRQMPQHGASWRELGIILRKQQNYPKAIACLRRSVREQPLDKQAWSDLIDTLKDNNHLDEASQEANTARKIFPEDISLLLNSAYALNEHGEGRQALALISSFFSKRPWINRPSEAWNCEGLILISLQMFSQAISSFRQGLRLRPSDSGLWNNMGMAYGLTYNKNAELLSYRNAIKHSPNDHGSHMNLGMALLAQKEFESGLKEYEWRLRAEAPLHVRPEAGELLTTDEAPQEIYICTEQGLGDVIQFSRYLYDLHLRYAKSDLILVCPEKLIPLLGHSFSFISQFISTEQFDSRQTRFTYAPIMSIPAILKIHPHRSLAPTPYIKIPTETQKRIKDRIQECVNQEALVIGLTWKGNPQTERTNLSGRSMALEELAILAEMLPNAVFLSVQKGAGSEEIQTCSFRDRFISIQDEITEDWCFVNNAGYMLACDHIITTDTCNAHLSGALGVPTHLILSSPCEWRWRGEQEQSEWYNSMRTYHQINSGYWREPIQTAAAAILNAASSSTGADDQEQLG